MTFTEPISINTSKNWTEEFNLISDAINNDPERSDPNVEYKIEITSDNPGSPMIIGSQIAKTGFYKFGKAVIEIGPLYATSPHVNKVTITGGTSNAYLKFANELYYGSWIPPLTIYHYYVFEYDTNNDGTVDTWVASDIAPNAADPNNPFHNTYSSLSNPQYDNSAGSTPVSLATVVNLTQPFSYWAYVVGTDIECQAGIFMNALYCETLNVDHVIVDGNVGKCLLGGNVGDAGIQSYYTGIHLTSCHHVTIDKCTMEKFGLDGIRIAGAQSEDIVLNESHFNYNARNAMAWIDGDNLNAVDCEFNHTGKEPVYGSSSSPVSFSSSPGSGLDVEPDHFCTHGTFSNCQFNDNVGFCVINDKVGVITESIEFNSLSQFQKSDGIGVKVKGSGFTFNNCDINTLCSDGYSNINYAALPGYATRFINCRISDKTLSGSIITITPSEPLYRFNDAKHLTFENCTLTVWATDREIFQAGNALPTDDLWHIIDGCTFIYKGERHSPAPSSLVKNIFFKNSNKIIDENAIAGSFHGWEFSNSALIGTTDPCHPSEILFDGQFEFFFNGSSSSPNTFVIGRTLTPVGVNGYAQIKIQNHALWKIAGIDNTIKVNPNARLIVEDKGSLACGGNFVIDGQLILESGSFIGFNLAHAITGTGSVYIHELSNNGSTIDPYWSSAPFTMPPNISPWLSNSSICIQGRTNLPPGINACTSPFYAYLSMSNSVFLMYNYQHVKCAGAANGSITATGSPGSIITINGAPPAANYGPGMYTVVATASGGNAGQTCTATTTVTISEPTVVSVNATFTNVSCTGAADGTITATGSPGSTITINGVAPSANYGPGVYTVLATAPGGNTGQTCTATTTVTITEPMVVSVNAIFTNVSCNGAADGTITATGSPGSIITINGAPPAANYGPGVYTVIATAAGGNTGQTCTAMQTVIIGQPSSGHCSCPNGISLVSNPDIILLDNPTANYILTHYGSLSTGIVSNKSFYIDNTLTIDQSIIFNHCTLYFTPSGNIVLSPSSGITMNLVNGSLLDAACEDWIGVLAGNSSNKISMSGSTIRNSIHGIQLMNDAILEVTDSHFEDNRLNDLYFENMTLNPYPGFILHNTFTTINTLPSPYTKTSVGIELVNVQDIKIGNISNSATGNTFENLYTGIWVRNQLSSGNNLIGIYNNSFLNIEAPTIGGLYTPTANKVNNCYLDKRGAGVYADFGGFPAYYCSLDIRNTNSLVTASFEQCDKAIAITGPSLVAEHLNISDCILGIMCSSPYRRSYSINSNHLNNVHIGIELFGRHERCSIDDNNILTGYGFLSQVGPVAYKAPTGIKVQYPVGAGVSASSFNFYVTRNKVNVRSIAGIGIYNAYADGRMYTGGNEVIFTTNSAGSSYGFNVRSLFGLYNDVCIGSTFEANSTIGSNNQTVWIARDSKGMYFSQGPKCKITCNKAKFTRYGFYVWGNNETDKENVTFNKFNANAYPWWFLDGPSATMGSFGDVGDPASATPNNGNEFLYNAGGTGIDWRTALPGVNPQGYKVFRASSIPYPYKIFASVATLIQSESGSFAPLSADYTVLDPGFGYNDPCPEEIIFYPIIDSTLTDNGGIIDNELAIANDSVDYINFPIVGGWIDRRRLYERLDADSILRYSNWDLLSFYNTYHNTVIGTIRNADLALSLLSDSGINNDDFIARYDAVLAENNNIVSSDDWEVNERTINALELKIARFGVDSVTIQDRESIQNLANSCPYVEGTSVYKARMLWSNFAPDDIFDDRIICIISQNKNQTNSDQDIDSVYLSEVKSLPIQTRQVGSNTSVKLGENISNRSVRVFPNPANSEIFIEYNCTTAGKFVLFNSVGQAIITSDLTAGNKKAIIRSANLPAGVYSYCLNMEGCIYKTGKLTILK